LAVGASLLFFFGAGEKETNNAVLYSGRCSLFHLERGRGSKERKKVMKAIDITDMSNRQIEELIQDAMVELQERKLVNQRQTELEDLMGDAIAQEEIKQSRRTTGA